MSFKHKIFEKEEENENIKKVFIYKSSNNIWSFKKDNKSYGLTPAMITRMTLSPLVSSTDRVIQDVCKLKNIQDPENGFYLYFSEDNFLDCDVKLEYKEVFFDGWVYDAHSENLQIQDNQKIWACTYLKLYFATPPKIVYLKISKT